MSGREHGIILLKPDGVKCGLEEQLYSYFDKYNLKVVARRQTTLIPEQVIKNMRTSFDKEEYARYLCSAPIVATMVRGDYTIAKLIKIKREIRSSLGVTCNDMCNYVHSADLGNEHYVQTQYLFPMLDVSKCGLYADMNICVSAKKWRSEMRNLENSSLSYIGLIIDLAELIDYKESFYGKKSSKFNIIYGVRVKCKYKTRNDAYTVSVIGYFKNIGDILKVRLYLDEYCDLEKCINIIHRCGGLAILDYIPYRKFISDDMLLRLKLMGIDGAVVYDVRYSMDEVARLEYVVADVLGLLLIGGSNGIITSGTLSIDRIAFELFLRRMKRYT